jgi:hypothetical protein
LGFELEGKERRGKGALIWVNAPLKFGIEKLRNKRV